MMKISFEKFRSPSVIFFLYIVLSSLVIMGFRMIFPGEPPPLLFFSHNWRLLQGLLDILAFFPALALSALVIPFGLIPDSGEVYERFSPKFFKQLSGPITTAICASLIYAVIFFIAAPLAMEYEDNIRYRGELFRLAKKQAEDHYADKDWLGALQFIGIAESVWPHAPELERLKIDATIQWDYYRFGDMYRSNNGEQVDAADTYRTADVSALPGHSDPLDAVDAIALGEEAFANERFFDAHWYATLGVRLARPGSIEEANARRLASIAWNNISSLTPDSRERERQSLYHFKQSGYEAMVSGDWIRAFYIFQELLELTPRDPDVANFYALSEQGTKETSFFMDEINLALGENLSGALFSIPMQGAHGGRAVLRFSHLSTTSDYAYGTDLEYLGFDGQSRMTTRLSADYVKLLPITLDDQHKVLILMRALDRRDESRRWEPEWTYVRDSRLSSGDTRIIIDVSYGDFLVLFRLRQGLSNMAITELFSLKTIKDAGYISQAVDAEILGRLSAVLFFLPMTAAALLIGWRFRAKAHPRYLFIPMLFILPLVFHGITLLYQYFLDNTGIWLSIGLGFTGSLVILVASCAVLLFILLMVLAAQKE